MRLVLSPHCSPAMGGPRRPEWAPCPWSCLCPAYHIFTHRASSAERFLDHQSCSLSSDRLPTRIAAKVSTVPRQPRSGTAGTPPLQTPRTSPATPFQPLPVSHASGLPGPHPTACLPGCLAVPQGSQPPSVSTSSGLVV